MPQKWLRKIMSDSRRLLSLMLPQNHSESPKEEIPFKSTRVYWSAMSSVRKKLAWADRSCLWCPSGYSSFVPVESGSQLFPFSRPMLVYARSLQPHSNHTPTTCQCKEMWHLRWGEGKGKVLHSSTELWLFGWNTWQLWQFHLAVKGRGKRKQKK